MMTELEAEKIIKKKYENCLDSLKNMSYDPSNNESMVDSPERFLNYDEILKKFYQSKKDKPKSPDTVIFRNNTIVFVEFKNGKISSKEKDKIKLKAVEGGIIALYQILAKYKNDLNFFDVIKLKKSYVLVYKEKKNPYHEIHERVYSQTTRFGLYIFEGTLYNKVKTISPELFTDWLNGEKKDNAGI